MMEADPQPDHELFNLPGPPLSIRRPCNASDPFCYCAGVGGKDFAGPCLIYSMPPDRNR